MRLLQYLIIPMNLMSGFCMVCGDKILIPSVEHLRFGPCCGYYLCLCEQVCIEPMVNHCMENIAHCIA